MIRLLCVEDNPLVRAYLEQRLAVEDDIRVISTVSHARGAVNYLSHEEIDIVLLDYQLEDADGMRVLDALTNFQDWSLSTQSCPAVLFCTGHSDEVFEEQARAMGARGVVAKHRMARDLVAAVRTVAAGGEWFGRSTLEAEREPGPRAEEAWGWPSGSNAKERF